MKIIAYQYYRAVAMVRESGSGFHIYVAHYPGRLHTFLSGPAEEDTLTRALYDAQPLSVVLVALRETQPTEVHMIVEAVNRAVAEFIKDERRPRGKRRV